MSCFRIYTIVSLVALGSAANSSTTGVIEMKSECSATTVPLVHTKTSSLLQTKTVLEPGERIDPGPQRPRTFRPTPMPTPVPTPMPTPAPTAAPTPTPTPAPAVPVYALLSNFTRRAEPAKCYKDLQQGKYVSCSAAAGSLCPAGSTCTNFSPVTRIGGLAGCGKECVNEPNCKTFKVYTSPDSSVINCKLYLVNVSSLVSIDDNGTPGDFYKPLYNRLSSYNAAANPAKCYKDLYEGKYWSCTSNCPSGSSCDSFTPIQNVSGVVGCGEYCMADPNCKVFKFSVGTNNAALCKLYMVDVSNMLGSSAGDTPGIFFKMNQA